MNRDKRICEYIKQLFAEWCRRILIIKFWNLNKIPAVGNINIDETKH